MSRLVFLKRIDGEDMAVHPDHVVAIHRNGGHATIKLSDGRAIDIEPTLEEAAARVNAGVD